MNTWNILPMVDLQALGWSDARIKAALAVAVLNGQRVADAALERLTLDDHVAVYPAWSEAQAPEHG